MYLTYASRKICVIRNYIMQQELFERANYNARMEGHHSRAIHAFYDTSRVICSTNFSQHCILA